MRMVAGVLVGIWVARYLGPAQFGLFSYCLAFVALFSSIAKLGLDSIIVRDLIREPNVQLMYMGTAFWLKMIGAAAMVVLIGITMLLTNSDSTTKLYIFIIAIGATFQSFEVIDFYFQSKVLSKFVSVCKMTQLFLSSLIKLYLIHIQSSLFWFAIVTVVDQLTLAVTLYLAYRYQNIYSFFGYFNIRRARKLLQESWPLILTSMVITIYMKTDQIMIQEISGAKEVGIYSAAVRLSEVWYFVPAIITNSLMPAIVGAKSMSIAIYHVRLQKLYTLMVWSAISVALPMMFLSNWLVELLYGSAYIEAGAILSVHIWTGVFVFFGSAWSKWMVIEGFQSTILKMNALSLAANILLNLALIPRYGAFGAALATLVSYGLGHTVFALFFQNQRIAVRMFWKAFDIRKAK